MGKLAQIAKTSKRNVILLKEEGYKNKEIAKRLGLSEASISRILKRNKENLTLSPMKMCGRFRKTIPRMDRKIWRLMQAKAFLPSTDIKRSVPELAELSLKTIRHRLSKDLKLPSQKPLKKPLLTSEMAKKRLEICNQYKGWTSENWQKSCFRMNQLFLIVCVLSGLKATSAEANKDESPVRRLLKNKQCEKVVFPQESNLQPLDYRSTALPLELEKTPPRKLNFGYLNSAT